MALVRCLRKWRVVVVMTTAVAGCGQSTRGEEPMSKIPTISVTGTGRIATRPDLAEISVGVTAQAPTAQVALSLNNESMNRLVATLKERGIAEKDIWTGNTSRVYRRDCPRDHLSVPLRDRLPPLVGEALGGCTGLVDVGVDLMPILLVGGSHQSSRKLRIAAAPSPASRRMTKAPPERELASPNLAGLA